MGKKSQPEWDQVANKPIMYEAMDNRGRVVSTRTGDLFHDGLIAPEGTEIEVMEAGRETNYPFKVFLTPAALRVFNENPPDAKAGRMALFHQVFSVLNIIIRQRKNQEGETILFSVAIGDSKGIKQSLKLEGLAGNTSKGQPSITVMMPGEKSSLNMTGIQFRSLEDCVCFKNKCKYYNGVIQQEGKPGWVHICKAFPAEIPTEIWRGTRLHSEPLPNQGNKACFERADTFGEMEMFKSKRGSMNHFTYGRKLIGHPNLTT